MTRLLKDIGVVFAACLITLGITATSSPLHAYAAVQAPAGGSYCYVLNDQAGAGYLYVSHSKLTTSTTHSTKFCNSGSGVASGWIRLSIGSTSSHRCLKYVHNVSGEKLRSVVCSSFGTEIRFQITYDLAKGQVFIQNQYANAHTRCRHRTIGPLVTTTWTGGKVVLACGHPNAHQWLTLSPR